MIYIIIKCKELNEKWKVDEIIYQNYLQLNNNEYLGKLCN